jgi:HAMP domain-containing protein
MAFTSIQSKLIAAALAVLALAVGLNAIVGSHLFSRNYSRALQGQIVAIGEGVGVQLQSILALGVHLDELAGFDEQVRAALEAHEDVAAVSVVDTAGQVRFEAHRDSGAPLPAPAVIARILRHGHTAQLSPGRGSGDFFHAVVPVRDGEERVQSAIVVSIPASQVSDAVTATVWPWLVFGLVSAVASAVLLFVLCRTLINRPLDRLLSAIQAVMRDGVANARHVTVDSTDEIGALGRAFNMMVDGIAEAQASAASRASARSAASAASSSACCASLARESTTSWNRCSRPWNCSSSCRRRWPPTSPRRATRRRRRAGRRPSSSPP